MNEDQVCPCCKQTLPPKNDLGLPVGYRVLFNIIREAGANGIRSDRLFQKIYAGVRDGGPDYKTLGARIWRLNRDHLKKHGLYIQGEKTGCREHGRYKVIHVV